MNLPCGIDRKSILSYMAKMITLRYGASSFKTENSCLEKLNHQSSTFKIHFGDSLLKFMNPPSPIRYITMKFFYWLLQKIFKLGDERHRELMGDRYSGMQE